MNLRNCRPHSVVRRAKVPLAVIMVPNDSVLVRWRPKRSRPNACSASDVRSRSGNAVVSMDLRLPMPVATVLPVKGYMGGVVGATQTVWFLQRALQSTSSLRMQAVRATSLGLPAATRRR